MFDRLTSVSKVEVLTFVSKILLFGKLDKTIPFPLVFPTALCCWLNCISFRSSSIVNLFRSSSIVNLFRSSSIFKNIEVVFHISSSWVKLMLNTENQLHRLSGSALKVELGWDGGGGPTNYPNSG
jgi:hypothetical protein